MNTTQAMLRTRNSLAILGLLSLCSCASIVDGGRRKVHIDSNPTGAQVTIYNRHGEKESVNTTPFLARLDRHSGYFRGEEYRLVFELAGYQNLEATVKSTLNPWYIGNLVFGGLIGLVIVDPVTGAMWTLKPNKIVMDLEPVPVAIQPPSSPGTVAEPKPEAPPSAQPALQPAPVEPPQFRLAPPEQPKPESATNEPALTPPVPSEPTAPPPAPKE
jgi:hypothetical protein